MGMSKVAPGPRTGLRRGNRAVDQAESFKHLGSMVIEDLSREAEIMRQIRIRKFPINKISSGNF